MLRYVDKNGKLREAFDKLLENLDLKELSSPKVVEQAKKLEELLVNNQ